MNVLGLLRALYKSRILLNPEKWKNVQLVTEALVVVVVSVLAFFPSIQVAEAQLLAACAAVATLMSVGLTVVTTKKVGLPPKGKAYARIESHFDDAEPDVNELPPAEKLPVGPEQNSIETGIKGVFKQD